MIFRQARLLVRLFAGSASRDQHRHLVARAAKAKARSLPRLFAMMRNIR